MTIGTSPSNAGSPSLGRRVRRRLRKYAKRGPPLLEKMFSEALGEIFSDPEAIVGLVIVGLALAVIVFILGGVMAAVQETLFGGGPPGTGAEISTLLPEI